MPPVAAVSLAVTGSPRFAGMVALAAMSSTPVVVPVSASVRVSVPPEMRIETGVRVGAGGLPSSFRYSANAASRLVEFFSHTTAIAGPSSVNSPGSD